MQQELDHLKRKLCRERRKRTLSISDFSYDDEEDGSYRQRSRTPPSESFSYNEDYYHGHKNRSSSSKGLGNDAISRALNKFPDRLSHAGLRRGDFLNGSLSLVHHVQWSYKSYGTRESLQPENGCAL